MDNRIIAQHLTRHAHLLEAEHAQLFRVQAYRRAAETVLGLDEPIEAIVARAGRRGLQALPGIGRHISAVITSLVQSGDFATVKAEAARPENTSHVNSGRHHVAKAPALAGNDSV